MFKMLKSIGLLNFGTIILYANVWSWKRKRLWLNRDVFVCQVDEGSKTRRQEGKGRSGFRKSKQDSKRVWESQLTSWQPRNRSLTQESSVLALRVQLFWASRTARSGSPLTAPPVLDAMVLLCACAKPASITRTWTPSRQPQRYSPQKSKQAGFRGEFYAPRPSYIGKQVWGTGTWLSMLSAKSQHRYSKKKADMFLANFSKEFQRKQTNNFRTMLIVVVINDVHDSPE